LNEQNEILSKNRLSNLPVKEERYSKVSINYENKSKLLNDSAQKKFIYLIKIRALKIKIIIIIIKLQKKPIISEIQAFTIKI